MRIISLLFFLFTFSNLRSPYYASSAGSARSYIVIEQTRGEVLEGKDIYLTRSVASISKIMTAIIAIEDERLYHETVIGDEIDNVVGSALYLDKGTHIRIIDLVYGLLLRSGNDAAMAIAKYIGNGEVSNFVNKMNDKAHLIGMHNTIFNNPHGLDIDCEGNMSCSYDMALLMRYCMNNELFRAIDKTKYYHCPNIGTWSNKHKLIHNYDYAIAGKTGFTSKAKRTLVSVARKDGLELIVVTLDCGSDFAFHRSLFENYFANYAFLSLIEKGVNDVDGYRFFANEAFGVMIPLKKAHHLLIVYALDPERLILSFRICYQDGTIEEYGPVALNQYLRI